MDSKNLNNLFSEWLYENYPDEQKKYSVAVYVKGTKKPETTEIDINSPTIISLIDSFYLVFHEQSYLHYSNLYHITRQLARYFNDSFHVQQLQKVYSNCGGLGIPLCIIEKIYFKDINSGLFKMCKTFDYGFGSKQVTFGDLVSALDRAKTDIFDIFEELLKDNMVEYAPDLQKLLGKTEDKERFGMPVIGNVRS